MISHFFTRPWVGLYSVAAARWLDKVSRGWGWVVMPSALGQSVPAGGCVYGWPLRVRLARSSASLLTHCMYSL